MSKSMRWYDWTAIVFVTAGAINWGLVAINPSADIVQLTTASVPVFGRILKGIIGVAGVWSVVSLIKLALK